MASRAGLDVPGNPWIGHNARDGPNSAAVHPAAPRNGTYFFARSRARAIGKFIDSGARDGGEMAQCDDRRKELPRVATCQAMCFLSRRVGPRGPWEGCVGNSFAASHLCPCSGLITGIKPSGPAPLAWSGPVCLPHVFCRRLIPVRRRRRQPHHLRIRPAEVSPVSKIAQCCAEPCSVSQELPGPIPPWHRRRRLPM